MIVSDFALVAVLLELLCLESSVFSCRARLKGCKLPRVRVPAYQPPVPAQHLETFELHVHSMLSGALWPGAEGALDDLLQWLQETLLAVEHLVVLDV